MNIRKLFCTILVYSISILYTQTAYTNSNNATTNKNTHIVSVLEEDTDLKNIEAISQGIVDDIIKTIPLNILKNSIVLVPTVAYSTNGIPVSTVFDSVFTDALIGTLTKDGIPVAPYQNKNTIFSEYKIALQKALNFKAQMEKKNTNQKLALHNEVLERESNIQMSETTIASLYEKKSRLDKDLANAIQAKNALTKKYQDNQYQESLIRNRLVSLPQEIKNLQDEINQLKTAHEKTIVELNNARKVKEKVEIILSTTGTPITEVNDIETKKRQQYVQQSIQIIKDKQDMIDKIRSAIEQRERSIIEKNNELLQAKVKMNTPNDNNTVTIALAQSDARIKALEQLSVADLQELEKQRISIQNEKKSITQLELKIKNLDKVYNTALPKLYEIKIAYSNVESVLFITAEVASGLYNSTVYLAKHMARITPYTAMLLHQNPLALKEYKVRSVVIPKPKEAENKDILLKEKGIH